MNLLCFFCETKFNSYDNRKKRRTENAALGNCLELVAVMVVDV